MPVSCRLITILLLAVAAAGCDSGRTHQESMARYENLAARVENLKEEMMELRGESVKKHDDSAASVKKIEKELQELHAEDRRLDELAGRLKIGVVDLQAVSENWLKWGKLDDVLDEQTLKANKTLEEKDGEIAALEQRIQVLPPDEPKLRQLQNELEKLRADREAFCSEATQRLENTAVTFGRELLTNMLDVVKKYGEDNNLTLILKKQEYPLAGVTWTELLSVAWNHEVLHRDEKIDLTDKITRILNEKYK